MLDEQYQRSILAWEPQTKELVALAALMASHAPLFPVMPFYVGTLWYSAVRYYGIHKHAHLDPEWAKEHLPWHYDHHMGKDQNANWCVTHPFWDHVMGTRKRYAYGEGVPRELPEERTARERFVEALRGELTRLRNRGEPERIGGEVVPADAQAA